MDIKEKKAMAERLAPEYQVDPKRIAHLCDNIIDRSGELLGYVRDAARKLGRGGMKIEASETVPANEIHFVHRDGRTDRFVIVDQN